jgi:hypothetical protein
MEVLMKKANKLSIRLDEEEYDAVNMIAKEWKLSLSEAYRMLVFEGIKSINKAGGDASNESTPVMTENIKPLIESLGGKIDEIRQNLDALAFTTLYHLLPVGEEQKEEAERSTWPRFFKYKIIARKIDNESAAKKSGTAKSS